MVGVRDRVAPVHRGQTISRLKAGARDARTTAGSCLGCCLTPVDVCLRLWDESPSAAAVPDRRPASVQRSWARSYRVPHDTLVAPISSTDPPMPPACGRLHRTGADAAPAVTSGRLTRGKLLHGRCNASPVQRWGRPRRCRALAGRPTPFPGQVPGQGVRFLRPAATVPPPIGDVSQW